MLQSKLIMAAIFSRILLKRLARLMAGLLLFTQLILSAQACMLPQPNPAHAFSDAMATEECAGVPMDRATCLADCLKADQASGPAVDFHFDVIPPSTFLVSALSPLPQVDSSAIHLPALHCRSGPLLQIVFCSFQI